MQNNEDKELQELADEFAFLRYGIQDVDDISYDTPTTIYPEEDPDDGISPDEVAEAVGLPDTTIVLSLEREGNEPLNISLENVSAEVEAHYDYVQVDIVPGGGIEPLKEAWRALSEYGEMMEEDMQAGVLATSCVITFIPSRYDGALVLAGANPLFWTMMAEDIGKVTDRIRLLFLPENVGVYESSPESHSEGELMTDEQKRERARAEYRARYGSADADKS